MSIETLAVVLAILYLVLAIRQSIWCWAAAFVSTSLFLVVFYDAKLYMESGLQVFYLVMAVYGWYSWRQGDRGLPVSITTWSARQHIFVISSIVVLSLLTGTLLDQFTAAALPFLDSLTTWGGIVATYMVARKVFENWHYWFAIDSLSVYLYLDRGLNQTAMLFGIYLVLIVFGYFAWRKDLIGSSELS